MFLTWPVCCQSLICFGSTLARLGKQLRSILQYRCHVDVFHQIVLHRLLAGSPKPRNHARNPPRIPPIASSASGASCLVPASPHTSSPLGARLFFATPAGAAALFSYPRSSCPPALPRLVLKNVHVSARKQQERQPRGGSRSQRSADRGGNGSSIPDTAAATARLVEAEGLSMIPPSAIR